MKQSWTFLLLLSGMIFAPAILAQGVYKCTIKGAVVYQGMPCPEGTQAKLKANVSDAGTSAPGSLQDLYNQIRAANDEERNLSRQMDAQFAAARARFGTANTPEANAERERIKAEWLPRVRAASERSKALVEQLRQRCPGGASLNGSQQVCRK